MARAGLKSKKLAVLELIKEKKSVLFGSFQNNATTKAEKQEAWTEVLIKAKSLGIASANRDWCYARDHIFGLWKSRTLAKRDNAKKIGTGGGKGAVMDEVDESILEIIGTDSSVVVGLNLPETDGNQTNTALPLSNEDRPLSLYSPTNKKRKQKRKIECDSLVSYNFEINSDEEISNFINEIIE